MLEMLGAYALHQEKHRPIRPARRRQIVKAGSAHRGFASIDAIKASAWTDTAASTCMLMTSAHPLEGWRKAKRAKTASNVIPGSAEGHSAHGNAQMVSVRMTASAFKTNRLISVKDDAPTPLTALCTQHALCREAIASARPWAMLMLETIVQLITTV